MEKAINQFLKRFRSVSNESERVENIFIPNEEQKTLRIAKTIIPENRTGFNQTFLDVKKELDKLKFNK